MGPMKTRSDIVDFLSDPENAQRLNGLVEDIRYALVDYQVCVPKSLTLVISNICLRVPRNEMPTIRASNKL